MPTNDSKSIFNNSVAVIAVTFLGKGSRLLSLLLIVRYLDSQSFGQFALIITLAELFRAVGEFGIDTTATKWLADQRRTNGEVLLNSTMLKILSSSMAALLLIATSLLLGYESNVLLGVLVAAAGYYAGTLSNLLRSTYQARLAVGELVIPSVLINLVYLAGIGLCALIQLGIVALVAVGVIADLLLFIYLFVQVRVYLQIKPGVVNKVHLRDVLVSSAPVGTLGIIVVLYARISPLIVANLGGDVALAHYTSSYRITEALMLVAGAFATSMLPVLTIKLRAADVRGGWQMGISSYLRKIGFVMGFCSLVLAIFPATILGIAFTDAYLDAAPSLAMLGFSLVFTSYNMLFTNLLYAADRQSLVLAVAICNLSVNIVLCFYLIPRWGIYGAATATTITEVCNTAFQLFVVSKVAKLLPLGRSILVPLGRFTLWAAVGLLLTYGLSEGISTLFGVMVLGIYLSQLFLFKDLVPADLARAVSLQRH